MNSENAKINRGYYNQALRDLDHLEIAREANSELTVANRLTGIAESVTHSKKNSALLFGGVLSLFGVHQLVGNETFTVLSSIPVNVVGGMVLGETTKIASRLHRSRVQSEGQKALNQNLKVIPSDEIRLGEVRDAVKNLMQLAPETVVKSGEVDRWVNKGRIRAEHRDDPRVGMAIDLKDRIAGFRPQDSGETTVTAFMRAQAELFEEKRSRKSIAAEARRLMLDQAAGQAAIFGLWGASLIAFGSKFSALTGGADDIATLGLIYLFTPAKKVFTSETANELYDATKNTLGKLTFWKKEEQEAPVYLLEGPKDHQFPAESNGQEDVIDYTNFPS